MTRTIRDRASALCVVATLNLLAASAPAVAAPRSITGALSKPGYTVIALAADGEARTDRARRGRFSLRPPATSVTLHLRDEDGTYAGPVVIDKQEHGKQAIVGARAGASLGRVEVKSRKGYARVSREPSRKAVDEKRLARAKNGIPIGAGVFGRVRSKRTRGGVPGDHDLDGIPDPLDIDDDGDMVLDNLDGSTTARVAHQATQQVLDNVLLYSALDLSLSDTTNINAGSTDAQINSGRGNGTLLIGIPSGGSAELDCGRDDPASPEREGLRYCSTGGTGRLGPRSMPPSSSPDPSPSPPFPGDPFGEFDPDGDGFGTLVPPPVVPPDSGAGAMDLLPGATTSEIKTGDVLIKRVNDADGVEIRAFSATLQYVFATVPALVSYSDTAGNLGTVSYPVAAEEPPPGPLGGPGTSRNGFPVAPGPDGDVVVTLTFWRPQRTPIGEGPAKEACLDDTPPCDWIDMGGLTYSARVESLNTPSNDPSGDLNFVNKQCPQSAYSATADQPLSAPTPLAPYPGLTDTFADLPSNPDNKLTYTLNLTQCLGEGVSWNSGETAGLIFEAATPRPDVTTPTFPGSASQSVWFKLK